MQRLGQSHLPPPTPGPADSHAISRNICLAILAFRSFRLVIHGEKPCLPFSSETQLTSSHISHISHICMDRNCMESQLKTMMLCLQNSAETPCFHMFSIFPVPALTCRLASRRSIRRTLRRLSWQRRGGTRTSKGPRNAAPRCAKATGH